MRARRRLSAQTSGGPETLHRLRRIPITAWPTGSGLPAWVTGRVTSCGLIDGHMGSAALFVVRLCDPAPGGAPAESVEQVTAGEVMRRVAEVRDRIGGIVIAGGEPLAQPGFTSAVMHLSHETGLHTTLETTGRMSAGVSDRMLGECDLVVLDLPSREGRPAGEPLRFLERLRGLGCPVRTRVPVVAGFTDTAQNFDDRDRLLAGVEHYEEADVNDVQPFPARAAQMRTVSRAQDLPVVP